MLLVMEQRCHVKLADSEQEATLFLRVVQSKCTQDRRQEPASEAEARPEGRRPEAAPRGAVSSPAGAPKAGGTQPAVAEKTRPSSEAPQGGHDVIVLSDDEDEDEDDGASKSIGAAAGVVTLISDDDEDEGEGPATQGVVASPRCLAERAAPSQVASQVTQKAQKPPNPKGMERQDGEGRHSKPRAMGKHSTGLTRPACGEEQHETGVDVDSWLGSHGKDRAAVADEAVAAPLRERPENTEPLDAPVKIADDGKDLVDLADLMDF